MSAADQIIKSQGVVRIGDIAPDFTAETSKGNIKFHDYIDGKWAILFSHPRDYTPICTTELAAVAKLKNEWDNLGVVPIALSVDTVEHHIGWIRDIEEYGKTTVYYPIIADHDYAVTKLYGMVNQEHRDDGGLPFTARSVFFIGPDKKVKATITYPASTGRSFDEIIRVFKSLQLTADSATPVATPADWQPGQRCVIPPNITTDNAKQIFNDDVEVFKPYLRWTADPSANKK